MKPDDRKTTYAVLPLKTMHAPKIIFGSMAIRWIYALVHEHDIEVGFYAIVDERYDGSYFIRDVFYPKHSEQHGSTCEISPEGETEMMEWLIDNGREEDISKVKFWGHSHVNMGTSPSGQDEKQALEMMVQRDSYVIRAIANKKGEMSVSFFDKEKEVRFDNVKWFIENDDPANVPNKIDQIREVVSTEVGGTNEEKLKKIQEIVETDYIQGPINEKVRGLKEKNKPPVRSNSTTFNQRGMHGVGFSDHRHGGFFSKREFETSDNSSYQEDLFMGSRERLFPELPWDGAGFDIMEDGEVEKMIEIWERDNSKPT